MVEGQRTVVPTLFSAVGELADFDCPPSCTCGKRSAKQSGLPISKLKHWIGASPDALLLDPRDPRGIFGAFEVKCAKGPAH